MRIVQGVPISWNPVIVSTKCPDGIEHTVWSPCSRFIAIECLEPETGIQILDSATLKQVDLFGAGQGYTKSLTFSSGSHLLAQLSVRPGAFISWDLQTGAPISTIPLEQGRQRQFYPISSFQCQEERNTGVAASVTYSGCGTMFGVLFKSYDTNVIKSYDTNVIKTYKVVSGKQIYSRSVGHIIGEIWTHGECLGYATLKRQTITIWEIGFTRGHPTTEVRSLPIPDNFDSSKEYLFLPALSRLAFILDSTIFVWDGQQSKILLDSMDVKKPRDMTFSSDGHFFACASNGPEIYLWKDSPTGYFLYQKLISSAREWSAPCKPFLSPDGKSIVASVDSALQLWHTTDSTIPPSTSPNHNTEPFILEFSLDKSLAATAQLGGNLVTVLDLKSGDPQLIINTDMKVFGLRVAGSTIVVVGDGKIVTWNLPVQNCSPTPRANISDSIQTILFDYLPVPRMRITPTASISPDLNHIAISPVAVEQVVGLKLYEASTGKYLASTPSSGEMSYFTPDGQEVWCYSILEPKGWAIVRDSESGLPKLEGLAQERPEGCPWVPSHGYKIMDDRWILDPDGKRLLWLPPYWRPREENMRWSGQFLALLHPELSEVVILEFPEK